MNIGLVLAGGMAKGAYEVGALKAISEFIPRSEIKYISCTSVGVLNGYAYAIDKLDRAYETWRGICENHPKLFLNQVLKSDMLKHSIKSIYDKNNLPESDFYVALVDMAHRSMAYKNMKKVDPKLIPGYLMASIAVPFCNRAMRIEGIPYYDAGFVDNIPVAPIMRHNLDYVICVYFDDASYRFESAYFDNKVIKIAFPSEHLLKEYFVFTKDSIEKQMSEGYDKARHILKSTLYDGYEDVEAVYRAIEISNKGVPQKFRVTGDEIVENLNKLLRTFAIRKTQI